MVMNLELVIQEIGQWVDQVAAFQRQAAELSHMGVQVKRDETDYVTDIDLQSEEMLIDLIRSRYPDHSILTEERGKLDGDADYLWLIDPIDGTTNFIHGFPLSSISIALQHHGISVAGMVHCPGLDMRFQATRGGGAYLNGRRLEVSSTNELKHSLLSTGFPNGLGKQALNLPYFNRMLGKVSGIRRTGSAALDLCFVAASYFDGYWEFDLNAWDMCAGALIAEEAGGKVQRTNIDGHALTLCCNPNLWEVLHKELLEPEEI